MSTTEDKLVSLGLSREMASRLSAACSGPDDAELLVDLLAGHEGERGAPADRAELLVRVVDESPQTLPEWFEGLRVFRQWIDQQGRTASLPKVLGYISCCAEATTGSPMGTDGLSSAVEEMLEAYGFDG